MQTLAVHKKNLTFLNTSIVGFGRGELRVVYSTRIVLVCHILPQQEINLARLANMSYLILWHVGRVQLIDSTSSQ